MTDGLLIRWNKSGNGNEKLNGDGDGNENGKLSGIRMGSENEQACPCACGDGGGIFARAALTSLDVRRALGLHHHHRPYQLAISLSVGPLSPHFVVSLVRFVSPLSG